MSVGVHVCWLLLKKENDHLLVVAENGIQPYLADRFWSCKPLIIILKCHWLSLVMGQQSMIDIMIRYLGIKTKIVSPITKAIEEITPKKYGVLDLFAGSNTVACALMKDYSVFTNDYQKYSYVAARTLIEAHPQSLIKGLSSDKVFGKFYQANFTELSKRFKTPLRTEQKLLDDIENTYHGSTFDKFVAFFNSSAYVNETTSYHSSFADCISFFSVKEIKRYKANNKLFPYTLFSTYYANPYFSLRQCLEVDSLRYSIDKLLESKAITPEEHNIYLSCLIYCLNLIVISVGDHFAQPQKIQDVTKDLSDSNDKKHLRERKKIIGKKRQVVQSIFTQKLMEFKEEYVPGNTDNKAFNRHYRDLLSSDDLDTCNIKTVYIDPPYTNAHYSRFYHIPETLVLYDYPDIAFQGRYRTDRYQSEFGIKRQAMVEFDRMLKLVKGRKYNAVISYSDTSQCILTIDDIKDMCIEVYGNKPNVIVDTADHMYRNFGQKPNKVLAKEYIISCCINAEDLLEEDEEQK